MKIEQQVLSREQMAHLAELGIDTSDASMMWYCCNKKWYLQINNELSQGVANVMNRAADFFVPTYTIGDLIEKLPSNIDGYGFKATIKKSPNYNYPWTEVVYDNEGVCTEYITSKVNPIHALYGFLCYVAKYHKELIK